MRRRGFILRALLGAALFAPMASAQQRPALVGMLLVSEAEIGLVQRTLVMRLGELGFDRRPVAKA